MIGIGVIGAGTIGEYHLRSLQATSGLEVRAICDTSEARARSVAGSFGVEHSSGSVADILRRDEIDAVTIGVPNAAHAEVAIAALQAGKHVFCEKPMARTAPEAARMVEAEAASGKLLMIGLVRRFDQKAEAARAITRAGTLGEIYHVRAGYLRRDGQPGGWFCSKDKAGGGALLDIGIHQMDLGLHLAELGPVRSVRGVTVQLPRIMSGVKGTHKYRSKDAGSVSDVEDHAVASLYFESGAVLTLEASWAQHREADLNYLEIYGRKGGLIVDPSLKLTSTSSGFLSDTTFPIATAADPLQEMFDREFAHYRDCLVDGVPCLSPSSDGVELMHIIDAIYESARRGTEVTIER
jgi:predicted dehydrogenase